MSSKITITTFSYVNSSLDGSSRWQTQINSGAKRDVRVQMTFHLSVCGFSKTSTHGPSQYLFIVHVFTNNLANAQQVSTLFVCICI